MPEVELKELFQKDRKELKAKAKYSPDLWVRLSYLGNRKHMTMLEGSKEPDFSGRGLRASEIYDNDKYWAEIVTYVHDWNMTFSTLVKLTDVELPGTVSLNDIVNCSAQNVLECFHEIKGFASFVVNTITDRIKFQDAITEAEKKTSQTLPDSDSE